jgi:adenosylmethionine---8-amino-7-oxononanoate aminotransferase
MVDVSATEAFGPRADQRLIPSFSMTSAAAGTSGLTPEQISAIDAAHVWHPYSTIGAEAVPPVVAVGARGARLIHDGGPVEVLDAMSSWWTAIHGHGHPVLDAGWP